MENRKILHLTKEESDLILIAIRQAYYETGCVDEIQYRIKQNTKLFAIKSIDIANLYNKVAQILGYKTRITEEE